MGLVSQRREGCKNGVDFSEEKRTGPCRFVLTGAHLHYVISASQLGKQEKTHTADPIQ